jgi:hypothetical protein
MGGKISKRTTKVGDEHWKGRPVSMATETVKQQIEQRIHNYRRVIIDEIAIAFNISHGSVYNIVHNDLRYRKVCSRWVPRQLSYDHKCAWQTICQEHLDRHAREGDAFLHRIVTGDESWVYHYEPESKRQSMQWKHHLSPANKNSRHRLPLGKSCWPSFGMSIYWWKRVKL